MTRRLGGCGDAECRAAPPAFFSQSLAPGSVPPANAQSTRETRKSLPARAPAQDLRVAAAVRPNVDGHCIQRARAGSGDSEQGPARADASDFGPPQGAPGGRSDSGPEFGARRSRESRAVPLCEFKACSAAWKRPARLLLPGSTSRPPAVLRGPTGPGSLSISIYIYLFVSVSLPLCLCLSVGREAGTAGRWRINEKREARTHARTHACTH